MENNISKQMYRDSREVFSLNNLAMKKWMYFIIMIFSPILVIPLLFIPFLGWAAYPFLIYGTVVAYSSVKRLHKMDGFRWSRVFVYSQDGNELISKEYFYALVNDNSEIVMIMNVVDIDKNQMLRDLLVAQMNNKNTLNSVHISQDTFKEKIGGQYNV